MKALVRHKFGSLSYNNISEPHIRALDEVKIKVLYSSFCRDDMRYEDKDDIFMRPGIIGHEAVGIIEETSDLAKHQGFKIGDLVVLLPWSSCGHCFRCKSNNTHLCSQATIAQGVICQFVVKKTSELLKIPSNMLYKQAVLVEPVACVLEAISTLKLSYRSRVAVIGAGFSGLCFIKLLQQKGVKQIVAVEPIAKRRKEALNFGADVVIDPHNEDFNFAFSNASSHEGFDFIIETSSNIEMANISLSHLNRGGTLKLYTYYGNKRMMSIPIFGMYYNNITISCSSLCGLESMLIALEKIVTLSLEQLVTVEYPFDKAIEAYDRYKGFDYIKIGINHLK